MIRYTTIESPLGPILLASDGAALTGIYLSGPDGLSVDPSFVRDDDALPFAAARAQLAAYFAGTLQQFDLPLAARGTPFQQSVWQALQTIPYGQTTSYGALAEQLGQPGAARAVGLANGRNPLSIIVPCHRVIGANGTLTGYSGGLERKRALLHFETAVLADGPQPFKTEAEVRNVTG